MGVIDPSASTVPSRPELQPQTHLVEHHPEDSPDLKGQADPPPPQLDPSAQATENEIREAKEADATARAAPLAAEAFPPFVRNAIIDEANSAAKKEWQDVTAAITSELQVAGSSVSNPADVTARSKAVTDRAQAMIERSGNDPRIRQITLDAQLAVARAQPAAAAIASVYGPEIGPKNPDAAEAEYKRQLDGVTPEQAAAITAAASPTLDHIAETRAQIVESALTSKGPAEAAAELRAQTERSTPEVAARIIEQSQPAIDAITRHLGENAISADRGAPRGRAGVSYEHQKEFDAIYGDLAAASNAASGSLRGQQAVQQVARSVANNIPQDNIGRFDESIGKAIADGRGAELSVAVVRELKAAGRIDQADDSLQNIEDGLKELKSRFDSTAKDYAEVNEEKFYLQSSYGFLADTSNATQQRDLQTFWQKYENDHPEIAEAQKKLDRVTAQVIEATTAIDAGRDTFSGLKHESKVQEAQKQLLDDPNLMNAVSLSVPAQEALAKQATQLRINAAEAKSSLAEQAYQLPKVRNFLEVLRDSGSQGRNAALRGGIIMTKHFMREATLAAKSGNLNAAKAAIDTLNEYRDVLGYSGTRKENFKTMLNAFKDMVDAGSDVDAAAVAFDKFKAASGDKANGPTLDPSSKTGAAMRMLGAAFALDVARRDIEKIASGSAEFKDYARTLVDTVSASQQSLMVAAGIGKAAGSTRATLAVAALDKFGDQVPFAGAAVDLILAADEFLSADGDKVQGSLYVASAAGNVALGTGFALGSEATLLGLSGAAWTGIGAVVLGVAFVGTLGWQQYRHSQEASKFETQMTEDYLQAMGVKPEIARELRNQDGDGHSPGPVFQQLAEAKGLDLGKPEHVRTLVGYLNGLSQDQMHNLVEAAHDVDPDDKGQYQLYTTKKDALLALPIDTGKLTYDSSSGLYIDSTTGKATTVQYDADERSWYDPLTQMSKFDESDRWVYTGRVDPVDYYTPHVANYDPLTNTAIYSDSHYEIVHPESVNGLGNWMHQQGYPELRAP